MGLLVAVFQYVSFFIFFEVLSWKYLIASSVSFILTVCVSYMLQKYVTFKQDRNAQSLNGHLRSMVLFFGNAICSLFVNGLIMYLGVDVLQFSAYSSQLGSMVILASYNFFIYRIILK